MEVHAEPHSSVRLLKARRLTFQKAPVHMKWTEKKTKTQMFGFSHQKRTNESSLADNKEFMERQKTRIGIKN